MNPSSARFRRRSALLRAVVGAVWGIFFVVTGHLVLGLVFAVAGAGIVGLVLAMEWRARTQRP